MCRNCWRRAAARLRIDLHKSIARNDALIRGARKRAIDAARSDARISLESLAVFRSRWT
jgi:hypothetical protein